MSAEETLFAAYLALQQDNTVAIAAREQAYADLDKATKEADAAWLALEQFRIANAPTVARWDREGVSQ